MEESQRQNKRMRIDQNSLSSKLDNTESVISQLKHSVKRCLDYLLWNVENQETNVSNSFVGGRPAANAESSVLLFQAAQDGDVEAILRSLSTDGVDLGQCNEQGDSALHVAARAGQERALIVLLGKITVASLNAGDKHGNSALVAAAKSKHWEIVKLLLLRGASAEIYKGDDNAPLYLVAKEKNYSLLTMMLKQIEQKGEQMKLALKKCDDAYLVHVFEEAVPGFCKTQQGCNAMILLAADGRADVLCAMLDRGADVDGVDSTFGASCLMAASWKGQMTVMKLFLDRDASVDLVSKNVFKFTALHLAAGMGHVNGVRLLLQEGASVDTQDYQLKTPIDVSGTDEIRQLLVSHPSQT